MSKLQVSSDVNYRMSVMMSTAGSVVMSWYQYAACDVSSVAGGVRLRPEAASRRQMEDRGVAAANQGRVACRRSLSMLTHRQY